ncbi:MAG: hypothetical protein NTW09_00370 [Candidatus Omnitrophica bacterium]|nr:hypothetical protein [Candidatus Omnitrophota bacterium]
MKLFLQFVAILMIGIAAVLNFASNTDCGRNMYRYKFCHTLNDGINKLFQNPNKYRDAEVKQRNFGISNFFYIRNDEKEFNIMKELILSNFYRKKVDYAIKAIIQYQEAQQGEDALNTNFNFRPVLFLKETRENKDSDVTWLTSDEIRKNCDLITSEGQLTRDIDSYLSNQIRMISMFFLVAAVFMNTIFFFLKTD